MTNKVYRSANGKQVDLGALILKNEGVTAVGNLNSKAKKEKLTEQLPQPQRQIVSQPSRSSNVGNPEVATSNKAAKRAAELRLLEEKTKEDEGVKEEVELRSAIRYLSEPVVEEEVIEVIPQAVEESVMPETVVLVEPEPISPEVTQHVEEGFEPEDIQDHGQLTGLQAAIARAKAARQNNL
jgi:hypothetical protein